MTYNNIACYFRRKGKLRTALSYLEKAQRIEMRAKSVSNPAGTRLNLCAVLSQLDRHQEALEHARAAVILLEEEIEQLRDQAGGDDAPEVSNKMAVLAICYHNLGVENEYLRHIPASLDAYQRGVAIARSYLGADNDITKTLVKSCKAAKEHLETAHKRRPESAARGASGPGASGASGPGASGSLGSAYDSMRELRFAQSAGARRAHSAAPSRPGSGMATPQPASRAGLDFSRSAPSSRPASAAHRPTRTSAAGREGRGIGSEFTTALDRSATGTGRSFGAPPAVDSPLAPYTGGAARQRPLSAVLHAGSVRAGEGSRGLDQRDRRTRPLSASAKLSFAEGSELWGEHGGGGSGLASGAPPSRMGPRTPRADGEGRSALRRPGSGLRRPAHLAEGDGGGAWDSRRGGRRRGDTSVELEESLLEVDEEEDGNGFSDAALEPSISSDEGDEIEEQRAVLSRANIRAPSRRPASAGIVREERSTPGKPVRPATGGPGGSARARERERELQPLPTWAGTPDASPSRDPGQGSRGPRAQGRTASPGAARRRHSRSPSRVYVADDAERPQSARRPGSASSAGRRRRRGSSESSHSWERLAGSSAGAQQRTRVAGALADEEEALGALPAATAVAAAAAGGGQALSPGGNISLDLSDSPYESDGSNAEGGAGVTAPPVGERAEQMAPSARAEIGDRSGSARAEIGERARAEIGPSRAARGGRADRPADTGGQGRRGRGAQARAGAGGSGELGGGAALDALEGLEHTDYESDDWAGAGGAQGHKWVDMSLPGEGVS